MCVYLHRALPKIDQKSNVISLRQQQQQKTFHLHAQVDGTLQNIADWFWCRVQLDLACVFFLRRPMAMDDILHSCKSRNCLLSGNKPARHGWLTILTQEAIKTIADSPRHSAPLGNLFQLRGQHARKGNFKSDLNVSLSWDYFIEKKWKKINFSEIREDPPCPVRSGSVKLMRRKSQDKYGLRGRRH